MLMLTIVGRVTVTGDGDGRLSGRNVEKRKFKMGCVNVEKKFVSDNSGQALYPLPPPMNMIGLIKVCFVRYMHLTT